MTARWSYAHTGGQPLTSLSVSYLFMEGTTINRVPVDVTSVGATSVEVRNLTTGFEYMFNITAANSVGAASVLCGPTLHAIGGLHFMKCDSYLPYMCFGRSLVKPVSI